MEQLERLASDARGDLYAVSAHGAVYALVSNDAVSNEILRAAGSRADRMQPVQLAEPARVPQDRPPAGMLLEEPKANSVFVVAGGSVWVETEECSAPGQEPCCLAGHDARSGQRLWTHCRRERLRHPPTPGAEGERVFAAFDGGTVICLEATRGELVWQLGLSEGAALLAQQAGELWVVTLGGSLAILDAGDGALKTRLDLRVVVGGGLPLRVPWRAGELIIAAGAAEIAAYPDGP